MWWQECGPKAGRPGHPAAICFLRCITVPSLSSLVAQMKKNLTAMWETQVQSLGWEGPLEKEMATHSGILAWKIPLT